MPRRTTALLSAALLAATGLAVSASVATLGSSSIWTQVTGSPEAGDGYGRAIAGTK